MSEYVTRRCDDTVDNKQVNSCILEYIFQVLEGVDQPKKSPKKPGNALSDTLLMSRFQHFAANAAENTALRTVFTFTNLFQFWMRWFLFECGHRRRTPTRKCVNLVVRILLDQTKKFCDESVSLHAWTDIFNYIYPHDFVVLPTPPPSSLKSNLGEKRWNRCTRAPRAKNRCYIYAHDSVAYPTPPLL